MAKFLLKRLLLFIPTLLVVSILTFFLSRNAPGDPVENAIQLDNYAMEDEAYLKLYQQTATILGLNKPIFYCQITTAAFPDTLYKIYPQTHKKTLASLIQYHGNWPYISDYYQSIKDFDYQIKSIPDSLIHSQNSILKPAIKQLYLHAKEQPVQHYLKTISDNIKSHPKTAALLSPLFQKLSTSHQRMLNHPAKFKHWIPAFRWYGADNQYHHWLINVIQGNLGTSLVDGRPVGSKIMDALRWTIIINGIAIFLAYFIAIFLGVNAAIRKGGKFDRLSTLFLFMLHSLPNFWIAILLVVFFTNPQFGMDWFPAMGLGDIPKDATFWEIFKIRASHLTLPILCLTYPSLAFISRQMRGAMTTVLDQDYIRTAKAKGVPVRKVIWKHAFPNSLFPIITLFASIFPAAISGSIVIEQIFSIPGMGRLMVESINQQDWPVMFGILILASILTILGILVADLLYAMADPRVKLDKE